jgi:hypothetical protein
MRSILAHDFCAVMTCSSADESCPSVKGAVERIAIPYEDPKVADNTVEEMSKYDERAAQICREILYAFSLSFKIVSLSGVSCTTLNLGRRLPQN